MKKGIRHWPASERPREKLLNQGEDKLSTAELLAIFLRTGTKGQSAIDLSRELLSKFKGLRGLFKAKNEELFKIKGIGEAKTAQLKAIKNNASALIFVHNHPSGHIRPSKEDRVLTRKLKQICGELEIRVLDHIIVGDNKHFSFAEKGLI